MNNASNSVKIDPLACAIAAVSNVVILPNYVKGPAIIKTTPNIVRQVSLCLVKSFVLFQ